MSIVPFIYHCSSACKDEKLIDKVDWFPAMFMGVHYIQTKAEDNFHSNVKGCPHGGEQM